jgi:ABC-type branched-subunit amino acid transport system substrate-binding protein
VYVVAGPAEQSKFAHALKESKAVYPLVYPFACDKPLPSELVAYPGTQYSLDIPIVDLSVESGNFKQRFAARFPKIPFSLDAAIAFDAVMMVAEAFKNGAGTAEDVRNFLLKKKHFTGAAGDLEFLTSGDSTRPVDVSVIESSACRSLGLRPSH